MSLQFGVLRILSGLVWVSAVCSISTAEAQSLLCPCLLKNQCLPPANALVVCKREGTLHLFDRNSMMRPEARSAELLIELKNENAAIRTRAATELGGIEPASHAVEPALIQALHFDSSKWVRRAAARALGRLELSTAEKALRIAASDQDRWVAHSANEALKRLALRAHRGRFAEKVDFPQKGS